MSLLQLNIVQFPGVDGAGLPLLLAAAFIAGLARGFSGFGAALIFVPLGSAAVGPKLAVPVLLLVDAVTSLPLLPNAWRIGGRREVWVMAAGAFVGVPLGTYVLSQADPLVLRWAIVGLVVALLLLVMSGWRYRGQPSPPLTVGVGALSGFLSGAAQVGGPPVVVYWLGGARTHHQVRANIFLYFAVSTVLTFIAYLAGGLLTREVLMLSILTAPSYGVGLWLGSKLFGKANETTFRNACFALIALAALLGLPIWSG